MIFLLGALMLTKNPFGIAHFYHQAGRFWLIQRAKKFQFRKVLKFNFGKNLDFCFGLIFWSESGVFKTVLIFNERL